MSEQKEKGAMGDAIFDIEDRGFRIRAEYVQDSNDAHLQVWREGRVVTDCMYPAYRIWNMHAHFRDMIDETLYMETLPLEESHHG